MARTLVKLLELSVELDNTRIQFPMLQTSCLGISTTFMCARYHDPFVKRVYHLERLRITKVKQKARWISKLKRVGGDTVSTTQMSNLSFTSNQPLPGRKSHFAVWDI